MAVIALLWGASFGRPASAQEGAVRAPVGVETPAAPYPEGATGKALVVLELEIAEDGTVVKALVREGAEPFAENARRTTLGWRFEPATRNGIPVRARVLARVVFEQPEPEPVPEPAKPVSEAPAAVAPPLAPDSSDPVPAPVEVTVVGEQREELGSIHIPRNETRQIPGAFGDPFRVVEILPGVAPILSGLPYFFVRGAPPGDTGYYVDGIRVPILFHVGAGPSVIAPALIERVDLFPSAYPARFGRAVGGVMAGETTPPSPIARGEAQARVFDAGAFIEAPFADGRGSALLGGRYSYTQALLALVAPDYGLGYGDYQARLAYAVTGRDTLSAFAFGSFDSLENREIGRKLFDVSFHRVDLRWDRKIENGQIRVAGTLGVDRVLNAEEDAADAGATVDTEGARLRLELEERLDQEVMLRGGADFAVERVSAEREQWDSGIVAFPARTDFSGGAWLDGVLRPTNRVELVPGFRLDVARSREEDHVFPEPRLATRVEVSHGLAWIAAFGIAHQLPTASVHVPGQTGGLLEQSVQTAYQASQGIETALPASMLARATAFYTYIQADDWLPVSAHNYGLELFLRRDFTERLGGFVSYTLSRSERRGGPIVRPSSFDRTHVLSAVLGYDLGGGFRLGTRAYYASGRYFIEACGAPDCGPGDPTAPPIDTQTGRLDDFFRLDLRFERRWRLANGASLAATFEWFNALLATEATGVRWDPLRGGLIEEDRSPLTLPSIGIEASF
jgi:hypothetical protein